MLKLVGCHVYMGLSIPSVPRPFEMTPSWCIQSTSYMLLAPLLLNSPQGRPIIFFRRHTSNYSTPHVELFNFNRLDRGGGGYWTPSPPLKTGLIPIYNQTQGTVESLPPHLLKKKRTQEKVESCARPLLYRTEYKGR